MVGNFLLPISTAALGQASYQLVMVITFSRGTVAGTSVPRLSPICHYDVVLKTPRTVRKNTNCGSGQVSHFFCKNKSLENFHSLVDVIV